MNQEQSFISAVVNITDDSQQTLEFMVALYSCLDEHFLQYEIIAVNTLGTAEPLSCLRAWAEDAKSHLTFVHLYPGQSIEQCMNAGIDIAIGDYVYEFDSARLTFPAELIWKCYEAELAGNDIVSVCPSVERWSSRLFYKIFNQRGVNGKRMRTVAFRLVSRRAINRTHAMNANQPYRKAAYSACGLSSTEIMFTPDRKQRTSERDPWELAVSSLFLYTDFGYRCSLTLSLVMLAGTVAMGVYSFITYLLGDTIRGWTTTMLALTAGLTGVFAILTMVLKYLDLILKMIFQKQKYIVEDVERL